MAGDEIGKNTAKPVKSSKPNSREARLAAALRENLRRRKAQERGRGSAGEGGGGQTPSGDENP